MSEAADLGNEIARVELEVMALKKRVASLELRADAGEAQQRVHTSELTLIKQALAESQDRLNMLLKLSQAIVAHFGIQVAP